MKNAVVFILLILLLEGCDFGKEEFYVVKVEADIGVTVFPPKATVQKGEEITFMFTLNEGYVLDSIVLNGVSITPISNTFTVIVNTPEQTVRVTTTEEEKQEFIISAIAKENGTISPSGEVKVTEGQDQGFSIVPNTGFLIETIKIDDQEIASSAKSYTFYDVSSNAKIETTFKKDSLLWPLLYIEWSRDSVYVDGSKDYEPGSEILNYYPGGGYTIFWNNKLYERTGWTLDKSKNPALITYGGRSCKIEQINEQKLIFSYINEINQKVTHVYSNKRYK